ncbi:Pre-mRNA-splicing factor cwf11 [Dissostichus eleginoides]|uniref:Pre-mRNA-splicing factor cwf11 n=1 Tax=Dissostichus eleginoides TaxID=100907 RepID=A0AAD9CAT4_DISEL|nr:Pre-mRNA-splicing factor cwf11 [Dissostichus eleginoides]
MYFFLSARYGCQGGFESRAKGGCRNTGALSHSIRRPPARVSAPDTADCPVTPQPGLPGNVQDLCQS